MKQSMAAFRMFRYYLQPGDGTAYSFYLVPLEITPAAFSVEAKTGEITVPMPMHELITGVGDWLEAERDFVTLGICMPYSQGSYEVRKSSLRNPGPYLVGYLKEHMLHVDKYTLAAVVLAAGVLVDRPDALVEAAEAMLRAPELLQSEN